MFESKREKAMRVALIIIGLIFIFGLYPLMVFFPEAWTWKPRQPEYEQMILGIYITLGIFLIIASRKPSKHLLLIWFTAVSSLVHGVIMLIQALMDRSETANLYGDVPAIIIIGIVLIVLMPRGGSKDSF